MTNPNTVAPDVTFIDETTVVLSGGQTIYNVHYKTECYNKNACVFHNPTAHGLIGQPLHFNGTHMYRKVNGELKVDPDDYLYLLNNTAILRNSALCGSCGDEIESKSRHDFVSCSCKAIFVDGGLDYIRQGGDPTVNLIDTSIVETKE